MTTPIEGWWYKFKELTDEDIVGYSGMVYCITNKVTSKKYIGKKLFQFSRRKPPLKGKTRKRRVTTQSDWRDYYGSNDQLKEDVESLGKEKFCRDVLYLCKTKGECNYLEAREQMDRRALESDAYYNAWIMVKVHRSHLPSKDNH